MSQTVEIVGLARVRAMLDPASFGPGLRRGLERAGQLVQREERGILHPHHFRGRAEQGVHVETRGSGLAIETRIGIAADKVPEGRPLAFGWKSSGGKQPPSSALVPWVLEKFGGSLTNARGQALRYRYTTKAGTWAARNRAGASQDAQVRSIAFLVARKIGRSGYSFAPLDWAHRGLEAARPHLRGIILAALRERRS